MLAESPVVLETDMPFHYPELSAQGDHAGDNRYCTVIATAVVIGSNFAHAAALLKAKGRRTGFGCNDKIWKSVIIEQGYTLIDVTKFYDGHSIRALAPILPSAGTFLITSHKHVSAVRDGILEDWSEMHKLYVKRVYKVVRTDSPEATMPAVPERRKRTIVINYEKPTKAVHIVADMLYEDEIEPKPQERRWRSMFRAKVSAECVANGINPTTAAVQTGKWFSETFGV